MGGFEGRAARSRHTDSPRSRIQRRQLASYWDSSSRVRRRPALAITAAWLVLSSTLAMVATMIGPSAAGAAPSSGGTISTVATTLGPGERVLAVAVDTQNRVLYSEGSNNGIVQRIDADGNPQRIAGGGTSDPGDGGAATSALIKYPYAMAIDAIGNVYVSESMYEGGSGGSRIRKIDTSGTISTFAGNGTFGFSGDGGLATDAQISDVGGLAVDAAGNVVFTDSTNQRIRRITAADHKINTIAGTGTAGFAGDGGTATAAQLHLWTYQSAPFAPGIAIDSTGNVFFADNLNNRVRKIGSGGDITTVAGGGAAFTEGGSATAISIGQPGGVVVRNGYLYVGAFAASGLGHRVLLVDPTGKAWTVAGTAGPGPSPDGGQARNASLSSNMGAFALDTTGNIFIGDETRIRRVAALTVPDAPQGVSAQSLNGSSLVSWASPIDGGLTISSWLVTAQPGGATCTSQNGTSCVVPGLSNGTAYTFSVTATNALGTGPGSQPSAPVTPSTTPGAPTSVTAVAGDAQVAVSWSAPPSNGGAPITGYTATSSPGGKTCTWTAGPLSCTVSGLTNGTPYTFTVRATNNAGPGAASVPSTAVTPRTAPSSPTSVAAVAGTLSATVAWTAPASNGGATITAYTVTASPGGATCSWSSGPLTCTVPGLTSSTAYTFTVTATNNVGTGPASAPSNPVTPVPSAPSAPSAVAGIPGNAQVAVTWKAPSTDGGAPITAYTVSASPSGATCSWSSGPLTCTVSGLTNGTPYTFTVKATNSAGSGPASVTSPPVTPKAVPGAPTGVTVVRGDTQLEVTWLTPASDGGAPITGYTVTASPGGSTCNWAPGPLRCALSGLTNGTSYTVTVTATNSAGVGPPSAPSTPLIPASVPGPPTSVVGTRGNAQITVSWQPPATTGGLPITAYKVTASPGGDTCTWSSGPLACAITGLTSGTQYTFTVTAANAVGPGLPSAPSAPLSTATAPTAPTAPVAVAGNGQVNAIWTAPASDGGLPITAYTVTASPGGATCSWTAGPLNCTLVGLTNGTAYTLTVIATNAVGASPMSTPSNSVVPATVPSTPTNPTASAGKTQLTASWSAPASDGGLPITSYRVTASPGGATCTWTTGPLSCVIGGLAVGATYTITVTATNGLGTSAPSTASNGVSPWDGAGYHPINPVRVLDSRTSLGNWKGPVVAGTPKDIQVTNTVPATTTAVVMNVTVTGGSTGSFVTAYPAGTATPNASNLNFGAGQTIPNLVTAKVGGGGKVTFANAAGSVDVIADVVGFYDDGTGPGDLFNGITPTRLLDSRGPAGGWNAKLTAGAPKDLLVAMPGNPAGVPATATAVVANVTVTGGTAGSFVSVWPSGVPQPNVSNLNFGAGETIPNLVIVKIGIGGKISFANAVGGVDVIVDVTGYFDPTTGSRFHAINPTRILDDRVGKGLSGPWGPNQSRALAVAGVAGTNVPTGATGLIANVTATAGTTGSFVTAFPDGVARPNSSNLNFGPGQTIPNLVTVKLPPNGKIDFYNALGNVDLIADTVGYYATT